MIWLALLVVWLLLLIGGAAVIESRPARKWLARLHALRDGRARQERDRDREAEERHGQKIAQQAEWIRQNCGWKRP